MKRILYLSILSLVFTACYNDDNVIDGNAISFYPNTIIEAEEEDGITYQIELETSSFVNGNATVEISVSNASSLFTNPPINGGVITLELTDTTNAVIEVTVLNDVFPIDYRSVFTITSVSGEINSIGSGEFTLFVRDGDTAPLFEDDFENGLDQWTIFNGDGNNTWATTEFSGNTSVLSSTFGSSGVAEEDNWLISEEIDFDAQSGETLTFLTKGRFNDFNNELEVAVLLDYAGSGDPSSADKIVLNPTLDPHEGGGFGDFTESGELDLDAITGTGRISFRFRAVNANDGAGWEVDDVLLYFFDPDFSSQGGSSVGGGNGDGLLSDGFEGCSEQFGVPNGWREEVVPGFKTNRGWGCRDDKARNGSYAVRASAFENGASDIDNTYLILNTPINFDNQTGETLTFWAKSEFDGDGDLTLEYSTDYSGSGNPEAVTWNVLTISLPNEGEDIYTEVSADLSAITGTAYIAFHFDNAPADNSVSWDLDDVSITSD